MDHPKFQKDDEGNVFLNFGSYGKEVEVAAISGDGRRVLTVRDVGVARVWEVESGEAVAEIRPESPLSGSRYAAPVAGPFRVFIEAAALSPDGTLALLGLNDGTAVVYRVADAKLLSVLHRPESKPGVEWGVIRSVRYSRDGRLALVGFPNRSVGVWSCDGARLVAFLEPPLRGRLVKHPFVRDTLVSSVASSHEGRFVFGGAVDMTAAVFDVESGVTVMEAREHAESILAIFDDGARVGWATTGGSIWLSRDGAAPQKCLETGEPWAEVTFHEDRALVRNLDDSIVLWSFAGERTVQYAPNKPNLDMWAQYASTLGLDAFRMYYPEGGKRLVLRDRHGNTVIERGAQLVRAALSPRGDVIATDGWTDAVELWDATSGALRHSLPCPGGSGCFTFSPDGELVATGEMGNGGGLYPRQVYVYEVGSGERRFELSGQQWQVRQVAFSPDGRFLASLADDLLLWDLSKLRWFQKEPILKVRLPRTTGAIAFAGSRLLALERGRVRIFERAAERLSFEAPLEFQTPWVVSQKGAHLCIGGNQAVFRYDLATGTLEREIVADILRPERFPSVPIAEEHRVHGGAMLWRTRQGCFLHQSDGPRGWIEPLDLSPEGLVAVPCESGAAVFQIDSGSTSLLGFVPFEGTLRAGRIAGGEVLLVNERGRCFRKSLSEVRTDYRGR